MDYDSFTTLVVIGFFDESGISLSGLSWSNGHK